MSATAVVTREPRSLTPEEYYDHFTGPELWRRRMKEPAPEITAPAPGAGLACAPSLGSLEEPDWPETFRGQVAKLLWRRGADLVNAEERRQGMKLQKKALRFLICNRTARPGRCNTETEHKYFLPNGCEVIFCERCADQQRRELFSSYLRVILAALDHLGGIPRGWTFARVTVTLRSDGSEITPERVKKFNAAVRTLVRKTAGRNYGMLFADEVGFETRGHIADHLRKTHGLNLHMHGLYLGPWIPWKQWRDEWVKISQRHFGQESMGFWIGPVKIRHSPDGTPDVAGAVRWALHHLTKYISKPPAVSAGRMASLIAAFHTARRVHALGLFAGKKSKPVKHDIPCPKCRARGLSGVVCLEVKALPKGALIPVVRRIEDLLAEGYLPLRSFRAFDDAVSGIEAEQLEMGWSP